MKRSGDRVIGSGKLSTPVILSGAPHEAFPYDAEGRGVEGSRRSLELKCSIREFSRELPASLSLTQPSSGSFDSPSQLLGLTQDDKGIEYRVQSCVQGLKQVYIVILTVLREIFDENAYDRFLERTHSTRSIASYSSFLREREAGMARKPRCC